jgi:hypothetical protein
VLVPVPCAGAGAGAGAAAVTLPLLLPLVQMHPPTPKMLTTNMTQIVFDSQ